MPQADHSEDTSYLWIWTPQVKDRGEKFSREYRLPFQVHTPVCITHETAERLNKNRYQVPWGPTEDKAFKDVKGAVTSKDAIAIFNPKLRIMVRVEASYNEGLSAGLFQQPAKGCQPVHFISRSLTDVEKRYSQTEKDALCVKWAKDRFGMYLQGAPRFTIVTAHKPLFPMFRKPSVKLSPRIEKWVMDMQEVAFEMKYEPGRDKLDPLDFLSRHPLPVIGNDDTEEVLKAAITTEHAVVLDRIREETSQDRVYCGSWVKPSEKGTGKAAKEM